MAAVVSGLNLRPDGQSEFRRHRLTKFGICLGILLLALFVRTLHWQDNQPVFDVVFSGMASAHKENANTLLSGDLRSFLAGPAPPTDANILTYPPGYPIFIAAIFRVFGQSIRLLTKRLAFGPER